MSNYNDSDNVLIKKPNPNNQTTIVYDVPYKIWIANNTVYREFEINHKPHIVTMPADRLLFSHNYLVDANHNMILSAISPNLMNHEIYQKIGLFNTSKNIVFVYPIFTQAAYGKQGFYDYYNKSCDSRCLTVKIPTVERGTYSSSIRGAAILSILNYSHITDVDIDKDPDILKQFDRVIMLHSEYVTQREFDAITSHPDVVYLYPNSLYAKVESDYAENTITLVRGHGYPNATIGNGFDWKFDNSKFEYNLKCDNWQFHVIDNGKMLDCYPSYRMYLDKDLLRAIYQ